VRFRETLRETPEMDLKFRNLVVVGMGGSGIVGDILRDYLEWEIGMTVKTIQDSSLPKDVSREDLVLGISFSGNTIETLKTIKQALDKGIRVVAITTGGELKRLAERRGFPVVISQGALAPRAALPQLSASALKLVLNNIEGVEAMYDIAEALDRESHEYSLEREENRAYRLAYNMWGLMPIFYANTRYSSLLHRAKSSINENAKLSVYYGVFPEGYHNEIEIYDEISDPLILPIILKAPEDDLDPLIKHLEDIEVEHIIVELRGENQLERILRGILLVDVASIYLAYLRKRDPYKIDVIEKIKKMRGREI
jgi:glucose/mannose-6-phosphate isomerase